MNMECRKINCKDNNLPSINQYAKVEHEAHRGEAPSEIQTDR